MRRLLMAGVVLLTAACGASGTAPRPTVTVTVTASGAPSASATTAPPPPQLPSRPVVAPDGRRCPDHPTPACTGLPPGTTLRTLEANDGPAHRVTKANTVLDGVHVTGDLLIAADNVKIVNSQIDGGIQAEFDGRDYTYSIADSTVGPTGQCLTAPAIGVANYTVERVLIRGHADGFRDSGDNISIKDSYAKLCSDGTKNYSDGVQTFNAGKSFTLDHTTLDMRGVANYNSPIFFNDRPDGTRDVTVTNNLVMGGNYTVQLHNIHGSLVVKNNLVVDKTWEFAPMSGDCLDTIQFEDNHIVTIDQDYRVTSIVRPLTCNGK
ncbi:hypothetical protein [Nonomuraea sp. NPDC049695]|uniref:hypothetical protein n=1 Tax=Nonomuraea sp. NPDC049695 TaxID=3154734 RepID=UPI00343DF5A8